MVTKNIAAFTPCRNTPPFVSINRQIDGSVSISVRGELIDGVHPYASIQMSVEEFSELLIAACNNIADILDENS